MNSLRNPHPEGGQLHADFAVVSAVQLNPARLDAAAALRERRGCLADVFTYYQGVDPAHEVDHAHFDTLTVKEEQDEVMGRMLAGLHAAEILVGSIVHPGLYDRRHSRRVRQLGKNAGWHLVLSAKSRGKATPYQTIGEALDEIDEHVLTTPDAETLSMSAEMLSSALTWWQIAKMKLYSSNKERFIKDDVMRTILDDFEVATAASTLAVQNMLKRKTIDETLVGLDPTEKLARSALGLKAQWRSSAVLLNPAFRCALPEQVTETLNDMIVSLHKEFVQGDLLDAKKYPKKEVKGLLHELVWLLDAEMVMLTNPDDFRTIHVGPSATRLDRPIIGRPALLRGIDYAIADADKEDEPTQLLNLKSGNGYDKTYHPRVKVIKERNFEDMHRGRLTNKLREYLAVIESGFDTPEARAVVEKYALETVQAELALHKNPSPSENWPYLEPVNAG